MLTSCQTHTVLPFEISFFDSFFRAYHIEILIAMSKSKNQAQVPIEDENYENVLKSLVKDGGVRGWVVVDWQGIPVKYHVCNIYETANSL